MSRGGRSLTSSRPESACFSGLLTVLKPNQRSRVQSQNERQEIFYGGVSVFNVLEKRFSWKLLSFLFIYLYSLYFADSQACCREVNKDPFFSHASFKWSPRGGWILMNFFPQKRKHTKLYPPPPLTWICPLFGSVQYGESSILVLVGCSPSAHISPAFPFLGTASVTGPHPESRLAHDVVCKSVKS